MKRIILLIVLIAVAGAGWYAYTEYNRKNPDFTNRKPDVTIDAVKLIAAFEKDTASANKEYVDKLISVTGYVKKIDADGNPVVIFLGDSAEMSSVICSMDSTHADKYKDVKTGSQVTLKGQCTGGKTEDLFGTDVTLNRCVVESKK